jgi:hypothetical protein
MKSILLMLTLLSVASVAQADSTTCSNPLACAIVNFSQTSPLDLELQEEIVFAIQHQCGVVQLTEKETTVSEITDSGAVLDTIYKSVLTGVRYVDSHPIGFEVYVTLTFPRISNPTVEVSNDIQIEGCK